VHIDKEDEDSGGGGFDEVEVDQAEKEEMAQALRAEQAVLANRGAAIMFVDHFERTTLIRLLTY